MFYKKINDEWYYGAIVCLPSGEILSIDNKINSDGWEWKDEPPLDFENNLVNLKP